MGKQVYNKTFSPEKWDNVNQENKDLIDDFSRFMVESDKRSINMNDVIEYGGIEIESIRKRTQFTYATKNGFEEIIKQKGDL